MSPFEMIMLACFGASWPFAIRKTWISQSSKGKSTTFLSLLIVGYACGVLHKALYNFDYVILLYIANGIMVSIDFALTIKFRRRERALEPVAA